MTIEAAAPEGAPPQPPATRRRGWMKILLVLSLALNLLMIGAAAGSHFLMRRDGPWGGNIGANLMSFPGELPAERRRELWRLTAEQRKDLWQQWREVGKARRETAALLRAEPFDVQKFATAHTRLQEAETHARRASQPLVIAIARNLTAEERAKLLKHREGRHGKHSGRRNWMSEFETEAMEAEKGAAPAQPANTPSPNEAPATKP